MKKLLFLFSFTAIFLMMATGAWATSGGVVKWSQPPDMESGVNIQSTEEEPIVADDWQCRDPRPVTDVHFWGSHIGWESANPEPASDLPEVRGFMIRIYKDVAAGVDPDFPYSHPGEMLCEQFINVFQKEYVASIKHPDGTFEHKFYYSLDLTEPFEQVRETIYWISIAAVMKNDKFPWGWETSIKHWNDNACRFWFYNNYWEEILPGMLPRWYPHRTVDMAFELTVEFEPPPPLEPIKWQQRPDMVQGVNIVSIPEEKTVADDWFCLDGSPVSDLHFWGSYPGWKEHEEIIPGTSPPGVEAFRIQVYSDRPVSSANKFSQPDKLLYEVWVKDFSETYVAGIYQPWWEKFEHKYRYDLDLPRIFWQKRSSIYWLNISALPQTEEFPWGWESSMDRWNDFAVKGWYTDPANFDWDMIRHPWTEKFIDMSFVLTTCKGPIKWLQLPDMANGKNIISLPEEPVVADDFLCTNGKPVTEVHFWGSYLNYDGEHWEQDNQGPPMELPPTPGVEFFKLSFHRDIPAGSDPDMPWSHPGEMIREIKVPFDNITEQYWDSIPHTDPTGRIWWEHKYYYIVRLEQPFRQQEKEVYWLDIGAQPKKPGVIPGWLWGWETSKDHWNDNAVRDNYNNGWWENLGLLTIDFENLIQGTLYPVGSTFISSGVPIAVKAFNGGTGGNAFVDTGNAGGSGNEINANNVNLDFNFNGPVKGLSLLFGKYGGKLNIEINNDFKDFDTFAQIDGSIIGGVLVTVVNGPGNNKGSLTLEGTINQFAVGGQELWIDNVKFYKKVDMAFLLITEDHTPYCRSDFNRDGMVNFIDLKIFAQDFGRFDCYVTGDCEGDFLYDGDVDGYDLSIFASEFNKNDCPCPLVNLTPSIENFIIQ